MKIPLENITVKVKGQNVTQNNKEAEQMGLEYKTILLVKHDLL